MISKEGTINTNIHSNRINFECKTIPLQWFKDIGIYDDMVINLSIQDNRVIIRKANTKLFKSLSREEKALQVKKYELLYKDNVDTQKKLVSNIAEYFNLSTRTVYRLLKEDINTSEIEEVQLLQKQSTNESNLKLYYNCKRPVISLSKEYACILIKGKPFEELQIEKMGDIITHNETFKIRQKLRQNEIFLYKN